MTVRSIVAALSLIASTVTSGGLIAPNDPLDESPRSDPGPTVSVSDEPESPPEQSLDRGPRTRWLAQRTIVSVTTPQTLLHLIDLERPERPPIEVERQSASSVVYSPDGRWLSYQSRRGEEETHLYIVDVSGDNPSQPRLLLESVRGRPCAWSPDSKKLACIRQSDPSAGASAAVVYFDTSQAMPGSAVDIGSFASNAHFLDNVFWSDSETLVFPTDGMLTKVRWSGGVAGHPMALGAPGGAILRLSPDGRRALVTGIRDYDPAYLGDQLPSFRIVDLEAGTSTPLPSHRSWSFSESLDAAIASDPGARHYYRIADDRIVAVATLPGGAAAPPWSREWQRSAYRDLWLGSRAVELRDGRPVVVTIAEDTLGEEAVVGDFTNVQHLRPSPDGTRLYIGSALLDDEKRPIDATATHWLSRIVDGHPQPAVQFASGYATGGPASISFSPSSRKLLLHGDHDGHGAPDAPVAFRLYELSGQDIQERHLDLQLRWAASRWSNDSSYLSIIGASKARTSFVVDTSDGQKSVRQLFTCNSTPAPVPGCPDDATF